jgi:hypothetical protein
LLQISDRVSTKRIRPSAGIQHCRGGRIEKVSSILLQAPYGDFGSRKIPIFKNFKVSCVSSKF